MLISEKKNRGCISVLDLLYDMIYQWIHKVSVNLLILILRTLDWITSVTIFKLDSLVPLKKMVYIDWLKVKTDS